MEAQTLKKELLKLFNFSADTTSASAFCQQRAEIKLPAFYHLIYSLDNSLHKETYKGTLHIRKCLFWHFKEFVKTVGYDEFVVNQK